MAPQQKVILNSTIMPFEIAADTPFYNDELFREYADRRFSGGVGGWREAAQRSSRPAFPLSTGSL
jgi:hypothetical protein